jgi:hypothetical protein
VTPGEDPEVKANLSELQKLIDRLNGGWPTDPETAAANEAAASVGAKVPGGTATPGTATTGQGTDRAGQASNPATYRPPSAAEFAKKEADTAIR